MANSQNQMNVNKLPNNANIDQNDTNTNNNTDIRRPVNVRQLNNTNTNNFNYNQPYFNSHLNQNHFQNNLNTNYYHPNFNQNQTYFTGSNTTNTNHIQNYNNYYNRNQRSYFNLNINPNQSQTNRPNSTWNTTEYFDSRSNNYSASYVSFSNNSNRFGERTFSYQESYNLRQNSNNPRYSQLGEQREWELSEFGLDLFDVKTKQNKIRKTDSTSTTSDSANIEAFIQKIDCLNFKIGTYNLLAPNLLEDNIYLYDQIDNLFLDWEYRKKKIMDQIKKFDFDVYCFQEMEENQFFQYFLPKLTELDYSCFYKKRLGDKKDGCAICFKNIKFDLVKEEKIEFQIPGVEILNRENIALILLLKCKTIKQEKYLCVATTHLLFNMRRGDCKLAQLQLLLTNLDRIAFHESKIVNNKFQTFYHPIIFCGDLNLTNDSILYDYILTSRLRNYKDLDSTLLSGQQKYSKQPKPISCAIIPEKLGITDQSQFKQEVDKRFVKLILEGKNEIMPECTFGAQDLSHGFNFKSVYDHVDEQGAPEITTCTRNDKKIVDYIFFHSTANTSVESKPTESLPLKRPIDTAITTNLDNTSNSSKLQLVSRLKLFTKHMASNYCIPNEHYPSDHFMLAANFILS